MLKRANENEEAWNNMLKNYSEAYPELAEEFKLAMSGKLPNHYVNALPEYDLNHSGASRADSGEIIQKLSEFVPSFFGGSADLEVQINLTLKKLKIIIKILQKVKRMVWCT